MRIFWAMLIVAGALVGLEAQTPVRVSTEVVGRAFTYDVQPGDTLVALGARHGVDPAVLARRNGRKPGAVLKVGERLSIDNRHIVPPPTGEAVLLNVPQRLLFHFVDGRLDGTYPVAVGRPTWQTPLGPFLITEKERDPTWDVPRSIQEEMRREGKPVIISMPPCPANPLGKYWMRTSFPGVGIHGTNAPASIYTFRTHGCVRLHPDDVCELFGRVNVGDTGRSVYEPTLLAALEDGRLFVEVHRDVYTRAPEPLRALRDAARAAGLEARIDWTRAAQAVREREGLAVEVTRAADGEPTAAR